MADQINWGILQPLNQVAPIRSATPSASAAPLSMGEGGGMLDPYEGQKVAIEQQRLGLEKQTTQSQLATAALQREGLQTTNASAKIDLLEKQRELKFQQNADQAFSQAKKAGANNEQALDAYQSQLSPEASVNMQKDRDSHRKMVEDNNAVGLSNAAGVVAETQRELAQTHDPMKQKDLLDNANRQLDRLDPDHTPIKSVSDLHNYSIATLGTLMNPRVQAQLNFELQKVNIQAQAQGTAQITTASVRDANAEAAKAQNIISTQTAYDNQLQKIQQWNKVHPDLQITTGPGTQAWLSVKQKAAAMGIPVTDLDSMEKLQGAHDNLVAQTLGNLKTIPRNEKVIGSFTNALSNPSDTAGAQAVKSRIVTYGANQKIAYADFLAEYKDANGNSTTGAQRQWSKFMSNDPSLKAGGLPNPDYVKDSDEYLKYIDKDYNPPKNTPAESSSNFQEGKVYQDANGNKATFSNGKWLPVQ